jgi:hypothetical protein
MIDWVKENWHGLLVMSPMLLLAVFFVVWFIVGIFYELFGESTDHWRN